MPFLETRPSLCSACATIAPSALGDRNRAKFQGAALSERSGFLRRAAIISPMIDTAISAGLTAPMSRPIGAWMRASAASSKPAAAHALQALGVGFPGAERADVEAVRAQRCVPGADRRSSDHGSEGDGGVAIERRRLQRFVGPLREHRRRRESARASRRRCADR